MTKQYHLSLNGYKRGYHLITRDIVAAVDSLPEAGMMNVFIQHTSAGLTLNENADPSVRADFKSFIDHLIPENQPLYTHTLEGADDMPAHLKASLIGQSISIPIVNGRLALGTWQGIYYCEFRNYPGTRNIIITVQS